METIHAFLLSLTPWGFVLLALWLLMWAWENRKVTTVWRFFMVAFAVLAGLIFLLAH